MSHVPFLSIFRPPQLYMYSAIVWSLSMELSYGFSPVLAVRRGRCQATPLTPYKLSYIWFSDVPA